MRRAGGVTTSGSADRRRIAPRPAYLAAALGAAAIAWVVAGYSLAFADGGAWSGGLGHLFLRGVGLEARGTIPHLLFMAFQGTFAIITAALIS